MSRLFSRASATASLMDKIELPIPHQAAQSAEYCSGPAPAGTAAGKERSGWESGSGPWCSPRPRSAGVLDPRGPSGLGCGLGPARGSQSTGQNDRKSPPEGALQCRQKHSILSLHKPDDEERKDFWKSSDGTQTTDARFHFCTHRRYFCFSSRGAKLRCNIV